MFSILRSRVRLGAISANFGLADDAANCAIYLRKALEEGYKPTGKELADHAFDEVRSDPDVKGALDLLQPPPEKSASSAPSGA